MRGRRTSHNFEPISTLALAQTLTRSLYSWAMLKQAQELREQPHFPINAGGAIIFADGEATVPCRVWRLSENAAMLLLTDMDWRVPNTFELLIDGTLRHVWVLWRRDNTLGVLWD
jgi:hypothetical protein